MNIIIEDYIVDKEDQETYDALGEAARNKTIVKLSGEFLVTQCDTVVGHSFDSMSVQLVRVSPSTIEIASSVEEIKKVRL